eukprot:CAMPEP_0196600356 /NCGR_PEP_ID=MMETSP1081-20130531/95347_1 /TAXON_ID=36882 /ORGANISM="Pyramimonas amylifera, Strain CCMP720" /LENGTH=267 /DNA_ID=CAMNT_0041926189 /DNA_START=383 /DNA_END=1186 /DNA_ORIENTATION=-
MIHLRSYPEIEYFVPGPLRRFVGSEIVHEEKWWYDLEVLGAPPYVLRFRQIPPLVGEGADVTGTVTIEAVSSTSCTQNLECEVKVCNLFRVPGTGRLAANGVKANLIKSYKLMPEVVDKWLACRGAMTKSRYSVLMNEVSLSLISKSVLANEHVPPPCDVDDIFYDALDALPKGSGEGNLARKPRRARLLQIFGFRNLVDPSRPMSKIIIAMPVRVTFIALSISGVLGIGIGLFVDRHFLNPNRNAFKSVYPERQRQGLINKIPFPR